MDTIHNVVMYKGIIYANVSFDYSKSLFNLIAAGKEVPFRLCSTDTEFYIKGRINIDLSKALDQISFKKCNNTKEDIFSCWVNKFTDWSLSSSQTLQIMVAKYDDLQNAFCDMPVTIKDNDGNLFFRICLANHRANASIKFIFIDDNDKVLDSSFVRLDRAHTGGINKSQYQNVALRVPKDFVSGIIRMEINYTGYISDKSKSEPFIFIADAHISPHSESDDLKESATYLYRSSDFDYLDTESSYWMYAKLPHISDLDTIDLVLDREKIDLFTVHYPEFFVRENYGHTLIIESKHNCEFILFIDGESAGRINVNAGDTVVRIPSKYMDGTIHLLSLRDTSGTVKYLDIEQLCPSEITPVDVIQRETSGPFKDSLFPQSSRRYAALKAQMSHTTGTDFAQIAYALSVLEAGYDKVKLKPLSFKEHENPRVSIIMPAHNKVEVTYSALCSLLLAYSKATFEVIVVDDASTDKTAEIECFVSGIKVVRNETAQRFIRACNAGAAIAQGEYIVLLNNDVEVTSGWMDELLDAFTKFDNVGAAGSKLLYPNGQLQDAGGIIWGNGNPWNYGNHQNASDPRFSYARQADYLSGAALMIKKSIWDEIGGLSSYLEPMYFEDTDIAFKVRDAGYTTWFVPSSEVYHYEGMTSGTDTSKGFKRYQEVNRPKFKRRWAQAYVGHGAEGHRPDLEKDRGIIGRVLFVDYTTPRQDQDAGSYAALQEIRLIQSLGYKVSFLPTNMAHLGNYTRDLQKMGVEMIYAPFYMRTSEYIAKHGPDFDIFYITRYYVAHEVLSQIRAVAPNAKVIFNNADLHFLREMREAKSKSSKELMQRAVRTKSEEMDIIQKVDLVLSYNEVEHSVINSHAESFVKVMKCPWVVDVPDAVPELKGRSGLSFLGSFRHHPNVSGIEWFCKEIMPLLENSELFIYGSAMGKDIKDLEDSNVHPIGFVENVANAFDRHRIFVAPLMSGAGIKGKVLSALSSGIPCVLTTVAAEGIGLRHGHDCFIVETSDEWVSAIARLESDDKLWRAMSKNARDYMRDKFSFDAGKRDMKKAFESIDIYSFA